MKKVFILAVVACSVTACKKSVRLYNSSIAGKWKLSEYLADPGDGSGTWQPADPSHSGYLEFNSDGTLTMSPYNIYNSDHYQVTSDSTMLFFKGSESFHMRYHFSETLLTLNPSCIEPCGERYIPARE